MHQHDNNYYGQVDEEGSIGSQEDTVKLKKESKSMEEAIEEGIKKARIPQSSLMKKRYFNLPQRTEKDSKSLNTEAKQ